MKNIIKTSHITTTVTAILWFLFDVFSKKWAIANITAPIYFIPSFLYLKPVQENAGIAFGLPVPMVIQIVGSIAIVIALIYMAKDYVFSSEKESLFKPILFGIILGGAIGNLVDRIAQGYVIDFIVMKPIPVFNVADIGITVGLISFFLFILVTPENKLNSKK